MGPRRLQLRLRSDVCCRSRVRRHMLHRVGAGQPSPTAALDTRCASCSNSQCDIRANAMACTKALAPALRPAGRRMPQRVGWVPRFFCSARLMTSSTQGQASSSLCCWGAEDEDDAPATELQLRTITCTCAFALMLLAWLGQIPRPSRPAGLQAFSGTPCRGLLEVTVG